MDTVILLVWKRPGAKFITFAVREKEILEKGTGLIFPLPIIDIYKK
jgi:hypothetical protein